EQGQVAQPAENRGTSYQPLGHAAPRGPMKICIISTSRVAAMNLGDELIANRCKAMVQNIVPQGEITTIFRMDTWENVAEVVRSSDLAVIACLAIRKDSSKSYPYMRELINSGTPIAVVSAGLSLGAFAAREPVYEHLTTEEIDLLKSLADRSIFFSTRGY